MTVSVNLLSVFISLPTLPCVDLCGILFPACRLSFNVVFELKFQKDKLLTSCIVSRLRISLVSVTFQSISVAAAQRKFFLTYKSYISGNDDKTVDNTSPEACASACLSEPSFICRSFDFDDSTKKCYLSRKSSVNSALASSSNFRFFELS